MITKTLIQRGAQKLNQWDGTNFIDDLVTKSEFLDQLNDRRQDFFMRLVNAFPNDFEREAKSANYSQAITATSASVGIDIYADQDIFDISMEGETIYNLQTLASAKILTFIDVRHVQLTSVVSWANNVLCVLNGRFPLFTGDVSDEVLVTYLGVKPDSTYDKYIRASHSSYSALYEQGREVFNQLTPSYYTRMKYLYVVPKPVTPVSDAIYMRYIELPKPLAQDTDEPSELPAAYQKFVYIGALGDAFEKKGDLQKAGYYEARYEKGVQDCIKTYRPFSRDSGFFIKPKTKRKYIRQISR